MDVVVKDSLKQFFAEAEADGRLSVYRKTTKVLYRPSVHGETIITTCGGKIETLRTCEGGEIVIQNIEVGSSAEIYVIGEKKFRKRYNAIKSIDYSISGVEWKMAQAIGTIEAFEWRGQTIKFTASWGEDMLCEKGDMMGRVPSDHEDMYRLEREAFDLTYKIKE